MVFHGYGFEHTTVPNGAAATGDYGSEQLFRKAAGNIDLLCSPSVVSAEVGFSHGKLKITVERESVKSIYPTGYFFNGQIMRKPYVRVEEVEKGGELTFRLSDTPTSSFVNPCDIREIYH